MFYQGFGVHCCSIFLEESDNARVFLRAPNNDLFVVHKYNTKSNQHHVSCFNLYLSIKCFFEICQLGIFADFIGDVDGQLKDWETFTLCKSESTITKLYNMFESHIINSKIIALVEILLPNFDQFTLG